MTEPARTHTYPSGQILELLHGDITAQSLDAIVNAANSQLIHGGGVAGAILRKGGPEIQKESNRWVSEHGPVSHNAPAVTGAGKLPCRYIIHAVGPVWGSGDEDLKLAGAVRGALLKAHELQLASLAIPPISTGIFGFPAQRAAAIFFKTIDDFFGNYPASSMRLVRLTIIDLPTLEVFITAFDRWASAFEGGDPFP
jgi:O-acetyl-ADP-ribose deacetylase (regulator of RNase III)